MYAENSENFNKIGDVWDPGTRKQMLVMSACGLRSCVNASWIFNELYGREPRKGFSALHALTVGPGMKSTGTRMHLQHAKG